MAEGGQVLVLGIAREFFKRDENVFEAGKVAAADAGAAESFEERRQERSGFGRLFPGESRERELGEFLGDLIRPEALEQRREFPETRGDDATRGGIRLFQTARVVQQNGASFAAMCVGAGFDQLRKSLANHRDGHAPNIGTAENGGFFPWGKFQPEALEKLLSLAIVGPRRGQGRKMLRGMRAAIFAGGYNVIRQLIQHGPHGDRGERPFGKFRGE
jgi:hypothetical protein